MPRALVLGLGTSGLAMARWLHRTGWSVRVADSRADPPHLAELAAELPGTPCVTGAFNADLLDDVQLLALSPGLSPTHSEAAPLLKRAKTRKIEILGEIEIFSRELARLKDERGYRPRVVGVTGTNGKTTTARLTGLLIERAGLTVVVAGNIGVSALDALRAASDAEALPQVWVLELSSFQLASTRSLVCAAAAVLNLSQDHLDWHGSMEAYASAKGRVFGPNTVQVINRDDAMLLALTRKSAPLVTFGAGPPSSANSYGLVLEHGVTWLAWAEDTAPAGRRRRAEDGEAAAVELHVHRLMPADALRIRGRHNALNALAAVALARAIDCPLAPLLHALPTYEGEPHRVQLIATVGGILYYDDSKGTNVGATVAALEGLGAEGRKLVVILGGDGKGQDFMPLAAPVARHAHAAVLIGRDAGEIRAVLAAGAASVPLHDAETLEDAVRTASGAARAGDAVLLSPACASFDMFRNYVERAEAFAGAVRELAAGLGQPC